LYGEGGQDYPDNAERFAFFCRAALEWLRAEPEPPDVLHVHEWQAALAPAFLRATAALYPELGRLRTVLTLHNLAFQGRFPADHWHVLNLDARYFVPEFLEFYGEINFLKAGMVFADALPRALEPWDAQLALLGSGEERYELWVRELAARFPGRVGARVGFDEGLAHRIEAGADVFLMPSRFEPCGLNQLYSLRYGT